MPEKHGAGAELEVLFRSKIPSLFWRTSGGHLADIRRIFGTHSADIRRASVKLAADPTGRQAFGIWKREWNWERWEHSLEVGVLS